MPSAYEQTNTCSLFFFCKIQATCFVDVACFNWIEQLTYQKDYKIQHLHLIQLFDESATHK